MPSLIEDCHNFFQTRDLYAVLSSNKDDIDKDDQALKKGYYKTSLKCHPDRASVDEKDLATKKFQVLGKVYTILSNSTSRTLYDSTGEIAEETFEYAGNKMGWDVYWRQMFKQISVKDIRDFETKYKHSEEEMADLKEAYMSSKGDMTVILSKVLCSFADDETRFRHVINDWISKEVVPAFDAFINIKEVSRQEAAAIKRKARLEKLQAEKSMKTINLDANNDSLDILIHKKGQERKQQMDEFCDHLLDKYGGPDKKRKT